MLSRQFNNALEVRAAGQIAGRIVREIHNEHLGVGPNHPFEFVDIKRPAVFAALLPPETQLAAGGAGDFPKRLKTGIDGDDVIAAFQQGIHRQEDAFFRHDLDNMLGVDIPVHVGDGGAQLWASLGLGVAEPKFLELFAAFRAGISQQFVKRQWLAVRRADAIRRVEFVLTEEVFDFKGSVFHVVSVLQVTEPGKGQAETTSMKTPLWSLSF